MSYRRIFLLVLFMLPGLGSADTFDIQLSNESSRFVYATEAFGGTYGPMDVDVGYYFNEHDDTALHTSVLVRNDSLDNPLVIAFGLRAYYADAGNQPGQTAADVAALTIGGKLIIKPQDFNGVGFTVYYFIAPEIVSFLDGEGLTEYGIRVDYDITEQAGIALGYRFLEVAVSGGPDLEVDSSAYFSVQLRF